jgi:hypothetical protein
MKTQLVVSFALVGVAVASANCSCSSGGAAGITIDGDVTTDAAIACAAQDTAQARVACAATALLALSDTSGARLEYDDFDSRTLWNNLPVGMKPRAGLQLSALSTDSLAAALDVVRLAMAEDGKDTATGVLRADDLVAESASGYGSGLYSIAIFGEPTADGSFALMFGGHHMAYNFTYTGSGTSFTPQHLGAEPKNEFTLDGATYAPLTPKADAFFAVYDALSSGERTTAYLSGQSFSDVVVAPDLDYSNGSGRTSRDAYPTGSSRTGLLVSAMSADSRALVVAVLEAWVAQADAEVADALLADYTSTEALADTYFAWGGSSSGPDRDASGSYFRIDGPRVWIEFVVQNGIVYRDETHYHSIFRDKTFDYGGDF